MKKTQRAGTAIFASVFTVTACITTVSSSTGPQKAGIVDIRQKLADERADYISKAAEKLQMDVNLGVTDINKIASQVLVIEVNSDSLSKDRLPPNPARTIYALGALQKLLNDHSSPLIIPREKFLNLTSSEHQINGMFDADPGIRMVARSYQKLP